MIVLVQPLVFVLSPAALWTKELMQMLEELGGPLAYCGQWHAFDKTSYYEKEMGKELFRSVASFRNLVDATQMIAWKHNAVQIEKKWCNEAGGRVYNLDVGYMDTDKVVLPSFKRGPCKLYAGEGVWLDMLLTYAKGHFYSTPWAFEDFVRNPYQHDLLLIREKFKIGLKTTADVT